MRHAEVPAVLPRCAGVADCRGPVDPAHPARADSRESSLQPDRARTRGNFAVAARVTPPRPRTGGCDRPPARSAIQVAGVSPVCRRQGSQNSHRSDRYVGRALGLWRARAGGAGCRAAGLEDPPANQARAAARPTRRCRVRLHGPSRTKGDEGYGCCSSAARCRCASRRPGSTTIWSSERTWRCSIVSGWDTWSTPTPSDAAVWWSKAFPRLQDSSRTG
jgi:hypothetical protein